MNLGERRRTWVILGGLVALGMLFAMFTVFQKNQTHGCTLVGGFGGIAVEVPENLRARLGSVRLVVRQDNLVRSIEFPAKPHADSNYLERGVSLRRGTYRIAIGGGGPPLRADWDPAASGTVEVVGVAPDGHARYRHQEPFKFKVTYPNGKGCDPEVLTYRTSISDSDRVR